jgi:hypothetical protein
LSSCRWGSRRPGTSRRSLASSRALWRTLEDADELADQYLVHRSADPFNIIEQIISDLHAGDIVIADLSGKHLLHFRNELRRNDVAHCWRANGLTAQGADMFDGSSHTRDLRALCRACSSLAACLCVAALVAACDESFDPIAPSELGYSVFGYLDASADTQWIRVMPIRPLSVTSQDPLGITVTLEQLGNGQIIELRDSLFTYSSYSDSDLFPEGAYLHNFWTPEVIEPGATYGFSARREGKGPAEAVVEVPLDYEVEVAINQLRSRGETDELRITGLKHLPFLFTYTYFYDSCGSSMTRTRHDRRSAEDGIHLIAIEKPSVTARIDCGSPVVTSWALWMVGSEAEWPTSGYSAGSLGESGLTSNVTNAVGFLGGVLTKLIPYERCSFQVGEAPVPQYCLLRYNQETATVRGTIRETRCGDGPLDSVTVQLTEMDRDPARIRTVLSNAGEFLIGALEPGIPHSMWVHAPPIPVDSVWNVYAWRWVYTEWEDIHTLHTDTLTFIPGEQVQYDINLERLTSCGEPPPEAR